jgi:polo-like kinase 1
MNNYNFPETATISEAAKDLITKILANDPLKRPSINDILTHHWIKNEGSVPL